jgi:hypothetical protein
MPRALLRPLRWRRPPGRRSVPLVGDRGGGAFLADVFPDARQWVEAAFGADLDADPDTWSWTNLAFRGGDVQWNPGVAIRIGYPDEVSGIVPAELTCDLRNDQANGGDYTIGNALSARWPNIRENTPIRARLDIGNGATVRFFGYATSWKPKRGPGGEKFVQLLANGVSRRVRQGQGPAKSAIRRFFEYGTTQPVRYWALEDGSTATSAASAITGVPPMTASGGGVAGEGVKFGVAQGRTQPAYTGFEVNKVGTKSFVSLAEGGTLTADLPTNPSATRYSVQFIGFTWAYTGSPGADVVMARWLTPGGSFVRYDVRVRSFDGAVEIVGFDSSGAETMLCDSDISFVDEFEYVFTIQKSGGNIITTLDISRMAAGINGLVNSFLQDTRAGTFAVPTRIMLNPNGVTVTRSAIAGSENQLNDMRFAHLLVWHSAPRYLTDTFTSDGGVVYSAWNGHLGESVADRLARLGSEQGVAMDIVGDTDIPMGFQDVGAFTDLIAQCPAVDQGVLVDGLGPGYTYFARTATYSNPAALTLSADDLPGEVEGRHDDRYRVNDYTASDPSGTSARFTQPDGELGTDTVGIYDDSGDHRAYYAADLYQISAWRVAQGTVPGVRWPSLAFQLAKAATSVKAQQWLEARPLSRIDVEGIDTGSNPDRALVLRGWTEKWNSKTWTIGANVTPYDAFGVTVLAEDSGDDDPFLGWLDTDGSSTQAGIDAGATSVVVVTPSGPVWTNATTPSPTYADDLAGLYINLDGLRVGVTAITGATSPQTFTLVGADVLRAVPAGAPVSAWDPVVIGL